MIHNELDKQTPGNVYLCQISESVSCGSCCGLYNMADISRENVKLLLSRRTELFENVTRDIDGFLKYEANLIKSEPQERPYAEFHHCPYVGFMGDKIKTVGCLLHPLARGNKGVDYRGISFYGGMACKGYFCLTCKQAEARYKKIVRSVINDWHLYGIIVTEWKMLNCFFDCIEQKINRQLCVNEVLESAELKKMISNFFNLKMISSQQPQANYFFEDREYQLPEINYQQYKASKSKYDSILRCFRYTFSSISDLRKAEKNIEMSIDQIVALILQSDKK